MHFDAVAVQSSLSSSSCALNIVSNRCIREPNKRAYLDLSWKGRYSHKNNQNVWCTRTTTAHSVKVISCVCVCEWVLCIYTVHVEAIHRFSNKTVYLHEVATVRRACQMRARTLTYTQSWMCNSARLQSYAIRCIYLFVLAYVSSLHTLYSVLWSCIVADTRTHIVCIMCCCSNLFSFYLCLCLLLLSRK